MSHIHKTGRPLTSKEARKLFNKRGGMAFTSENERRRLVRAQEREEQHERRLKQEAARKEARREKEERDAKTRAEHRRLGIPDPAAKVRQSQMRIAGFFRAEQNEDDALTDDGELKDAKDDIDDEHTTNNEIGLGAGLKTETKSNTPFGGGARGSHDPETSENLPAQQVMLSTSILRGPSASLDWDGFLITNSQIEREISYTPPPADRNSIRTSISPSTRKVSRCTQESTTRMMPLPASDDINMLLEAISTQEFRQLSPEDSLNDVTAFLNDLSSSELDNID